MSDFWLDRTCLVEAPTEVTLQLRVVLTGDPPLHQPDAPTRVVIQGPPATQLAPPHPMTLTLRIPPGALAETLRKMGR